MTEAAQTWGNTVQTNQTAFNVAFGTEKSFFEHIGEQEETAALFARYMRSRTKVEELALRHILEGFDWAALRDGHVVDVSCGLSFLHSPVPQYPLTLTPFLLYYISSLAL